MITLCSCREEGMIEVDLRQDSNTYTLKPEGELTSGCELHITGHLTCDVEMSISGGKGIKFTKGSVDVRKRYEWYSGGRTVTMLSDSCTTKDSLRIYYTYSTGYFGQPRG